MTIEYEVSRVPGDHRIKSIRGWYEVVARHEGQSDFAIRKTEEEAKAKAAERLRYRMNGFV
jgi:hypothetical protein